MTPFFYGKRSPASSDRDRHGPDASGACSPVASRPSSQLEKKSAAQILRIGKSPLDFARRNSLVEPFPSHKVLSPNIPSPRDTSGAPLPADHGWIPDPEDPRDFTESHPAISPLIKRRDARLGRRRPLPARVDLRRFCPPPMIQGTLRSCSAHAAVAVVEFAQKQATGRFITGSRLFTYKTSRDLMMTQGDTGAYLRVAMQSLVLFGTPPEKYWPYDPSQFDTEPPSFCYAMAADFKVVRYFRHDPPGRSKADVLARIKSHLAHGTPAIFGTLLFDSVAAFAGRGYFAVPAPRDNVEGGHAMVAVGYDDHVKARRVRGAHRSGGIDGSFLVLNSVGADWGFKGFGWLPYEYVLQDIATDWWSILHESWVDFAEFSTPSTATAQKA